MTRNQITLSGEIKEEYQTEAEEAKAREYIRIMRSYLCCDLVKPGTKFDTKYCKLQSFVLIANWALGSVDTQLAGLRQSSILLMVHSVENSGHSITG